MAEAVHTYTLQFITFNFSLLSYTHRSFAATIPRPFTARYNPYTQSIEILDNKEQIVKLSYDIAQDMHTLTDALQKLK